MLLVSLVTIVVITLLLVMARVKGKRAVILGLLSIISYFVAYVLTVIALNSAIQFFIATSYLEKYSTGLFFLVNLVSFGVGAGCSRLAFLFVAREPQGAVAANRPLSPKDTIIFKIDDRVVHSSLGEGIVKEIDCTTGNLIVAFNRGGQTHPMNPHYMAKL